MKVMQLIKNATLYLQDEGYTESTKRINFTRHWDAFRISTEEDTDYSSSLVTDYVVRRFGKNLFEISASDMLLPEYRAKHALSELNRFFEAGSFSGTSMAGSAIRQPLTRDSQEAYDCYRKHLDTLEYASSTIHLTEFYIHAFLAECPIERLEETRIIDYLQSLGTKAKISTQKEIYEICRFLLFSWQSGLTYMDFSVLALPVNKREHTEIPSVYSPEEIVVLLNHLAAGSKNPLRNFTIALFLAVYGFRAGDVAKMNLRDISWDDEIITVIQSKTKSRIEHKLTGNCGKALAEYILKERPESETINLFLKSDGKPMTATAVSSMIFAGFICCGIRIGGRKHGSHSLRHSLATNMLEQGACIMDISHTLGHESVDTTKNTYAKVDLRHLRMCELEVPFHG